MINSLIKNIISLSALKAVDLILPLVIIPYLILTVGKINYGVYAFSYAFIFYFLNLTQYGFSLSAVKDIAIMRDDKEKVNEYFNEIMTAKIFLTLLSLLIILSLCLVVPKLNDNFWVIIYMSFLLVGDCFSPIWYFQGIEKMQFITYANVISKLMFLILVFLFIKVEADYLYIGIYQSFSFFLAGIISIIYISVDHKIKLQFTKFSKIKEHIKKSFTSFLTLFVPTLYANTSVFILGMFAPYQSVTFLEVATKISSMFSAGSTVIARALYPFLNRNKTKTKKAQSYQVLFGFLTSILMFFGGEIILNLWFKIIAEEVLIVLRILSFSPLLLSVIYAYGVNGLLVLDKEKEFLKSTVFASLFGLMMAVILIPNGNYITAAIVIILARGLYSLTTYFLYKKEK